MIGMRYWIPVKCWNIQSGRIWRGRAAAAATPRLLNHSQRGRNDLFFCVLFVRPFCFITWPATRTRGRFSFYSSGGKAIRSCSTARLVIHLSRWCFLRHHHLTSNSSQRPTDGQEWWLVIYRRQEHWASGAQSLFDDMISPFLLELVVPFVLMGRPILLKVRHSFCVCRASLVKFNLVQPFKNRGAEAWEQSFPI